MGECKTDLESSTSDGLGYRETLLLSLLSWRLTLYFLGLLMKFCGQQPPGFVTFREWDWEEESSCPREYDAKCCGLSSSQLSLSMHLSG